MRFTCDPLFPFGTELAEMRSCAGIMIGNPPVDEEGSTPARGRGGRGDVGGGGFTMLGAEVSRCCSSFRQMQPWWRVEVPTSEGATATGCCMTPACGRSAGWGISMIGVSSFHWPTSTRHRRTFRCTLEVGSHGVSAAATQGWSFVSAITLVIIDHRFSLRGSGCWLSEA